MRSLPVLPSSYRARAPFSDRIAAALGALAISALLVIMLLRLGGFTSGPPSGQSGPLVVQLLPQAKEAQPARPQVATSRPSAPKPPPLKLPPVPKLNMLILSREEFAASDIARLSPRPANSPSDAATGADSGADESVGRGPNGERLYNAEWYREPTRAEMATYLPGGAPEKAWAMIACRTADRYHVEDCQELGESPPGSGLARALRLASWQFLVRPPRVGGKSMVGEWVRIRFDFTQEKKG